MNMKSCKSLQNILTTVLCALMALVVLSGCHSREKIVYIQKAEEIGTFEVNADYEARIKPDQLLSILVTCSDLQLAIPFNLQRPQTPMQEGGGSYSTNYQDNENLCYRVERDGTILFPMLGRLYVAGMTRSELSQCVTRHLQDGGFITDPIVNVSFADVHYSVIGEVNSPGIKPMTHDRVTVFEAIASAGDMTIYGERDKVRLIRHEAGQEHVVTLDLTDPAVLTSPYYFVRADDVLYVEPSAKRAANREVSNMSNYVISLTSIALTLASLVITLVR